MLPYFYPPEYFSYNKQFPHDYSTAMFPYDKEKDPRFVELLKIAIQRNEPLTKEELSMNTGKKFTTGECILKSMVLHH